MQEKKKKTFSTGQIITVTSVIILFLLYQTLIEACGQMLQCETLDNGAKGTLSVLQVDRSIDCHSRRYKRYGGIALALLIAVGVGAPAAPQAGSSPDGLRQALRGSPVGCANREAVGLTRREREACDEAFGRARDQAVIFDSPMDPAKRAAWDAVAARKAMIRKRKEGAVPPGIATNDNAGGTRTNGIGIGILGY